MSDIRTRVIQVIVEHLGVIIESVTDDSNIVDDLGADSLDTIELVMALEEELGIEIPDETAETLLTVGDVVKFIHLAVGTDYVHRDFDISADDDAIQDEIFDVINESQSEVLPAVEAAILDHIGSQSPAECLKLVLRRPDGKIAQTLPMSFDTEYATALINFIRKKDYKGYSIDSGLTDSTAERVSSVFSDKLGQRSDIIAERLAPLLLSNARFTRALSAALIDSYSGPIPRVLQKKVLSILTSKLGAVLSHTVDTTTTATIKASVMQLAGVAISSPIAVKVTSVIVASLLHSLKPILLKLFASTAFKTAILSKLKSIIIAAFLMSFIKIIGAPLGLSAGAAFMVVLIPIVALWLRHEYLTFSDKLATNVSEAVTNDLANNFRSTSLSLSEMIVERILSDGTGILAGHIVSDTTITNLIETAIKEAGELS